MHEIIICTYDRSLLPEKKTPGAACRDLKIAQELTIKPQEVLLVGTGIKMALPLGRYTKLYARSGLPIKSGLMLANSVGIIDSDYRGEYLLQFYNFTAEEKTFAAGSRLGQMEITHSHFTKGSTQVPEIKMIVDEEMYAQFETVFPSERGVGGFNSTGI